MSDEEHEPERERREQKGPPRDRQIKSAQRDREEGEHDDD